MKSNLIFSSIASPARPIAGRLNGAYYSLIRTLLAARNKYYQLPGRFFDARFGVDTCGFIQSFDLIIPERYRDDAYHYQPTKIAVFSNLIRRLPIGDRSRYAFVDFGCGKGRCLMLAAGAGFRPVLGVELSESLCTVARRNAHRFGGGRHAANIEVRCGESASVVLPPQPSVYFFYNPFGENTMLATMRSISKHLDQSGSEAYAIYVIPRHTSAFAEAGFELVEGGKLRGDEWTVWYRPAAAPRPA